MTSAPNIEMIASSLRRCSLNSGFRRRARHQDRDEGGDDSEGFTVELNSEVALPYRWQQCLDIRTGQVYYVNWEDGTRTTVDPRTSSPFSTLSTPRSISTLSTPRSISTSRRAAFTSSSGSSYTSASSAGTVTTADWFSSATGGYGYDENDSCNAGDEEESSSSSSRSSAVSTLSPTDESASSGCENGNPAGHVLVAAGAGGASCTSWCQRAPACAPSVAAPVSFTSAAATTPELPA